MSLIDKLIDPVSTLLDKWIPDADTKAKLAHDIATLADKQAHDEKLAQIDVNKEEAKHSSIFVSGWRPFVGWVCGVALAYNFIIYPLIKYVSVLNGIDIADLPVLNSGELMTVLMGMLGLGGLRTIEKSKGVARE